MSFHHWDTDSFHGLCPFCHMISNMYNSPEPSDPQTNISEHSRNVKLARCASYSNRQDHRTTPLMKDSTPRNGKLWCAEHFLRTSLGCTAQPCPRCAFTTRRSGGLKLFSSGLPEGFLSFRRRTEFACPVSYCLAPSTVIEEACR